jgi:hypothetical protein
MDIENFLKPLRAKYLEADEEGKKAILEKVERIKRDFADPIKYRQLKCIEIAAEIREKKKKEPDAYKTWIEIQRLPSAT